MPETKPRVHFCILCGPERHNWVNPKLVATLLRAVQDQRFTVDVEFIFGTHGIDRARNLAIDKAKEKQADWCIQIDNDITVENPLGILTEAIAAKIDIVSVSAAVSFGEGDYRPNVTLTGERSGNFMRVTNAGAGVLMIRSSVWQKMPNAPLFVWSADRGEDTYFASFAQGLGFKLWTHASLAGHLKTTDLTPLLKGVVR